MLTVIDKPSVILRKVLSGAVDMRDVDPSIRSLASFEIYKGACAVLKLGGVDARRSALARIPEKIRPYVEQEARRVFELRKNRRQR